MSLCDADAFFWPPYVCYHKLFIATEKFHYVDRKSDNTNEKTFIRNIFIHTKLHIRSSHSHSHTNMERWLRDASCTFKAVHYYDREEGICRVCVCSHDVLSSFFSLGVCRCRWATSKYFNVMWEKETSEQSEDAARKKKENWVEQKPRLMVNGHV